MTFSCVLDISSRFFKIQVIEIWIDNPCWHITPGLSLGRVVSIGTVLSRLTQNPLDFTYLGNCPANSLFRNPNLKFVLGKKNDDWNLYHSLPTQTTLGSSGSWLTAIQVSVTPW